MMNVPSDVFFTPHKNDQLKKNINKKMSFTYFFDHDTTKVMNGWKEDFAFIPNFDYVKMEALIDESKKNCISIESDDDNDDEDDEDDESLPDMNDDKDKCIQITIEDSDEEIPMKEEKPLFKRKYEEISPYHTNDGDLAYFPIEILNLIISILLERKHSDGKNCKKSFFPPWMAQFHTLKTFRNLSHSFRSKINHCYTTKIIESIRYFQKRTPIFDPVLKKIWHHTTKNLLLQQINDWSFFYHKKSQQKKEQNHESIWLMFKTLVYLSSDFPKVTLKKRRNLSGESGLNVYKHLNHENDICNFLPMLPECYYNLDKVEVYKANFGPVTQKWKIHQDEEVAFFKAAKTKIMLSGDGKNRDDMIEEIYKDLLNVLNVKINVF